MRSHWVLLVCFIFACASSHEGPDAGAGDAFDSDAAQLALGSLMPQAVAGNPGAVMAQPTAVVITYDIDVNRTDIEAFFHEYAASPAWAIHTSEYGIGSLTVGPPRHLAGTAATSDAQLHAILKANLTGATPAWGVPSKNTVYSFTLPAGTAFDDGTGSKCCVDYDGYHDDVIIGGVDVAYALQCMCGSTYPPPGITPMQELTTTASHELVEAVTDPRPEHDYAYADADPAHAVWTYVTDGELGDFCEFADTAYWTSAPSMTFTIQRMWSNAAARAGTDPCVGDPTTPYYQAVPDQPDDLTISPYGDNIATKGMKVAQAATGTITLHVAGTGSAPFTIKLNDVAMNYMAATKPALTFVQPTGTFRIGDTVTVPVTVMAKDLGLGMAGAEGFEVATTPVGGGPTTRYYGLVGQ